LKILIKSGSEPLRINPRKIIPTKFAQPHSICMDGGRGGSRKLQEAGGEDYPMFKAHQLIHELVF